MSTLIRCIRSDFYKFRHTSMIWIHLFIPLSAALIFLAYFSFSPWKPSSKVSGYIEVIGIAFPLIIGLICSKAVEQEKQAGNFQSILCVKSRSTAYLSKLIVMLLQGHFAVAVAIGIFATGFKVAPSIVYFNSAIFLAFGSVFLYIVHLFAGLKFGRGACVGLGIVESLISALALTGLGDGIWYFIPCTWCARLGGNIIFMWIIPSDTVGYSEIQTCLLFAVPATVTAFVLSLLWFKNWEGRKSYD